MTRWIRDWGPALGWAAAIFLVSERTAVPVDLAGGLDKAGHFAAYLLLGGALSWGGARRGLHPLAVVALGLGYAATDELHQMLVPGRSAELLDWFADAAGTVLGVTIFYPLFTRLAARGGASRQP